MPAIGPVILLELDFSQEHLVCPEIDIEDFASAIGFVRGEEIERKACDPSLLEITGDKIVARTESPAAASVGEDHQSERLRRKAKGSFKGESLS